MSDTKKNNLTNVCLHVIFDENQRHVSNTQISWLWFYGIFIRSFSFLHNRTQILSLSLVLYTIYTHPRISLPLLLPYQALPMVMMWHQNPACGHIFPMPMATRHILLCINLRWPWKAKLLIYIITTNMAFPFRSISE